MTNKMIIILLVLGISVIIKGEDAKCEKNSECSNKLACLRYKCVDPCEGVCGLNSYCESINHKPICSCPTGSDGDPFVQCLPVKKKDVCKPNPCGENAECSTSVNKFKLEIPKCECKAGFTGSPIDKCTKIE